MKSRCMSMMRSAVLDQSSSIGSGSAIMVPENEPLGFVMTRAPTRELQELRSKSYAILHNFRAVADTANLVVISIDRLPLQRPSEVGAPLCGRAVAYKLGRRTEIVRLPKAAVL